MKTTTSPVFASTVIVFGKFTLNNPKNENDKVEFEFKGVEAKKFLGLFNVNLPKTITVDANTGEVLSNKQTVWTKFLNLLSN